MKYYRFFMIAIVTVLVAGSVMAPVSAQDDMVQANKAAFTRIIDEAWNQGNLDVVGELVASDFVAHTPNGDFEGADSLRNLVIGNLRNAMSDLNMRVDVLIGEADWIGSRVTLSGTFDGQFLTSSGAIPGNGQPVVLTFNLIDRFNESSQFLEEWTSYDSLAFLTQLGAIPAPEGGMGDMTIGVAEQGDPSASADPAANKAGVSNLVEEAFNQGNIDAVDELISPDYVSYDPGGVMGGGIEDFKTTISGFRAAMPDLKASVPAAVAEGDWVMFHFSLSGTFTAPLAAADGSTIPPTGQPLAFEANILLQFNEQGQAVAEWDEFDNLGFLTQLGLISME